MANILIVDDSKFMRSILSDILTNEGHQIVGEAENAQECVELYHRLKPDIVTLDIIMPVVENIDAIFALKKLLYLNPLAKVVIVSAMGQPLMIKEYMNAGAMDFIVKPFHPATVIKVVEKVLRG